MACPGERRRWLITIASLPRGRIENQHAVVRIVRSVEVEHPKDGPARQHVERLRVANRPESPVVFDEAEDGGGIVEAVIHEVAPGVWRNKQAGCIGKKGATYAAFFRGVTNVWGVLRSWIAADG